MAGKVLIVEDDLQIAELLKISMKDLDLEAEIFTDGVDGLQRARAGDFELIILDVMLPFMNGVEICRQIRTEDSNTPVLMITAKSEESDKVAGLEAGADDYITKPFSVLEMQARVKALLRRSSVIKEEENTTGILTFGQLELDGERRLLKRNGETIDLTTKEFDILLLLARNKGKSFKRSALLNLIWGYDFAGMEHTVNSHINRLRSKVEKDMNKPEYILTTWGYGYRFNEDL